MQLTKNYLIKYKLKLFIHENEINYKNKLNRLVAVIYKVTV